MNDSADTKDDPAIVWSVERLDLESGAATYPAPVRSSVRGFYSTLERAEAAIRAEVVEDREAEAEDNEPCLPLRWDLTAYLLDVVRQCYRIRRYTGEGAFLNEVRFLVAKDWPNFPGVRPEECRFKPGDLVELVYDDRLVPGIVAAQPPTPEFVASHPTLFDGEAEDVYLVLFDEEFDHEHPDDGELMPPRFPVPNELEHRLRKRLRAWLGGKER